jgi:hypothetical protein
MGLFFSPISDAGTAATARRQALRRIDSGLRYPSSMTFEEGEPASRAPEGQGGPLPRPAPTLYFIDIPRTGGSRVRPALATAFGTEERTFVYDEPTIDGALSRDAFERLPRPSLERLRLVMGRFHHGLHERSERPFIYASLLRDPVERTLALYEDYIALLDRRDATATWPATESVSVSLEAFVFGQQHLAVDNGMVRAIAGRKRVRFGRCPPDLLDEAQAHIKRDFAAVLVSEEPERSFQSLGAIVGQELPLRGIRSLSKPATLRTHDASVLDRIRKLNTLDMQLYESASARLRGTDMVAVG